MTTMHPIARSTPATPPETAQRTESAPRLSWLRVAWSIEPSALLRGAPGVRDWASAAGLSAESLRIEGRCAAVQSAAPSAGAPRSAATLIVERREAGVVAVLRVSTPHAGKGPGVSELPLVRAVAPAWRASTPAPLLRLIHADAPGVLRLSVLHDLASGRAELLLGASPLLTDRLGLAGGTFDAPRLEVAT